MPHKLQTLQTNRYELIQCVHIHQLTKFLIVKSSSSVAFLTLPDHTQGHSLQIHSLFPPLGWERRALPCSRHLSLPGVPDTLHLLAQHSCVEDLEILLLFNLPDMADPQCAAQLGDLANMRGNFLRCWHFCCVRVWSLVSWSGSINTSLASVAFRCAGSFITWLHLTLPDGAEPPAGGRKARSGKILAEEKRSKPAQYDLSWE